MSVPCLKLCLSRSPLISPAHELATTTSTEFIQSLLAQRRENIPLPPSSNSLFTDYASSTSSISPTSSPCEKALPLLPRQVSARSVISLLRILDDQVASEVERITIRIREARDAIEALKIDRKAPRV